MIIYVNYIVKCNALLKGTQDWDFFWLRFWKEGGLYYMGGTYICFFHPKWSKLCTAPVMGPKNPPPIKKKFKKIFLTSYLDPLKKGFFALFTLFLGVCKYFFFHPKWSKLCTAPLKDPKNPHFLKKIKKIYFWPPIWTL